MRTKQEIAHLLAQIPVGTIISTDTNVYYDSSKDVFFAWVVDAAGNRQNELKDVKTIEDLANKYAKSNWKWTAAGQKMYDQFMQGTLKEGMLKVMTIKNPKKDLYWNRIKRQFEFVEKQGRQYKYTPAPEFKDVLDVVKKYPIGSFTWDRYGKEWYDTLISKKQK